MIATICLDTSELHFKQTSNENYVHTTQQMLAPGPKNLTPGRLYGWLHCARQAVTVLLRLYGNIFLT